MDPHGPILYDGAVIVGTHPTLGEPFPETGERHRDPLALDGMLHMHNKGTNAWFIYSLPVCNNCMHQ